MRYYIYIYIYCIIPEHKEQAILTVHEILMKEPRVQSVYFKIQDINRQFNI